MGVALDLHLEVEGLLAEDLQIAKLVSDRRAQLVVVLTLVDCGLVKP